MASPVLVNGYKVGSVVKINIDPEDFTKVLVTIDVKSQIKVPKNSKAIITNMGLVSGKGIIIEIRGKCDGSDCAQPGDWLEGSILSMLGSMLPQNEMDIYFKKIKNGILSIMDTLQTEGTNNVSIQNSKDILQNLASITRRLDNILLQNQRNLEMSVNNIEGFSKSLKENDKELIKIISNVSSITNTLNQGKLDSLLFETKTAVKNLSANLNNLQSVIKKTDNTFSNIDRIVNNIDKGEGSLGKLMKDKELYEELDLTLKHTNLLLQDMRLYPGRYFNISLLKSKTKEYQKVENDPGLDIEH